MSEASNSVKWWLLNNAPVDVLEAFEAQTAELQILRAKVGRVSALANQLSWTKKTRSISDDIRIALSPAPVMDAVKQGDAQ